MSDKIKYVVSFNKETKFGFTFSQILFDSYEKAIDFAHDLCVCSNIKNVYLDTLVIKYSETSVLKK